MENCNLHARHTLVSVDDSSRNIKGGEQERKDMEGANFEALSGYEKIRIIDDEWYVYHVWPQNVISVIDSAHY